MRCCVINRYPAFKRNGSALQTLEDEGTTFRSATDYPVTQRHIAAEQNPHTSMVMSCAVPKDRTDSLKVQSSGTNHSEDMGNTFKMIIGFN